MRGAGGARVPPRGGPLQGIWLLHHRLRARGSDGTGSGEAKKDSDKKGSDGKDSAKAKSDKKDAGGEKAKASSSGD